MTAGYEKANLAVVTFFLDTEEYGVDIECVREIDRMVPITRLPRVPAHVDGVINLRGQLLPVVDLRTRFGLPRVEPTRRTRVIVTEVGPKRFGMVVDAVSEVVRIPLELIEATPELLAGPAAGCVNAVGKLEDRLIILLDVARVMVADPRSLEGLETGLAKDQS